MPRESNQKTEAAAAAYFFQDVSSLQLVRRLIMENFNTYAKRYAAALFFMVIVAGMTALSAWIMRDIIESLFIDKDFNKIKIVALVVVSIFLIKGVSSYFQIILLSRVGNDIVASIQMQLYEKIVRQGGDFYIRYPSNDLVTRISSNAQSARKVIDVLVVSFGRDLLTLIGLVIVMIIQDWVLALTALLVAPPIILLVSSFVRRVRKVAKQQFISSTLIISAMQDTLRGITIVKSFGMEDTLTKRMFEAVDDVRRRNNKIAELSARTSPVMESFGGICIGVLILYAGWQVSTDSNAPGEFMAFLTAMLLAYDPARRLARMHIGLEAGLVGVRLMYEILDGELLVTDKPNAPALTVSKGKVVLRDVDFTYRADPDKDLRVFNALNLVAEGGKTTALVGPSGGGKTTIINLIQRFYDVENGVIEIDGNDIRSVKLESLRENIAFVSQDTFLFSGSVYENILAGRAGASAADVEAAARDANAHSFIEQLEHGYETPLGENGASLSGGQRQRIAIARAILKNAPIVLLDEATSALDTQSEKLVQEAFERLKKGRTTLVIAHRLSTIRNADCIHVIQDGRCVESGSHETLMRDGVTYKALHELQFQGVSSDTSIS
ncbi:MAG: ABC transporter ATP-binding protein [Hyphomicrobiales bacterium]